MKRKFLVGASFSALMLAAMAPWSASHANGISVRVSTPEFGIRIGAPHFPIFQPVPVYRPVPVYQPVPVYHPRPYRYAPPAVIYTPPPRWGYGNGGYGRHRHHWQHRHHGRGHGHDRHDHGDHRDRHDRHGGR